MMARLTAIVTRIEQIIGDYREFFGMQKERLLILGIDILGCQISHLAFRTETFKQYLVARDEIERHCSANVENEWNGRPISKAILKKPLSLNNGFYVEMIEIIPPAHQAVYRMGLEHVGIIVGNKLDEFAKKHRHVIAGQQNQSKALKPYFISFEDHTNVKFYRTSLREVCVLEGRAFDGFHHVVGHNANDA